MCNSCSSDPAKEDPSTQAITQPKEPATKGDVTRSSSVENAARASSVADDDDDDDNNEDDDDQDGMKSFTLDAERVASTSNASAFRTAPGSTKTLGGLGGDACDEEAESQPQGFVSEEDRQKSIKRKMAWRKHRIEAQKKAENVECGLG